MISFYKIRIPFYIMVHKNRGANLRKKNEKSKFFRKKAIIFDIKHISGEKLKTKTPLIDL